MRSFALFPAAFIVFDGLVHAYVYVKLKLNIPLGRRWSILLVAVFTILLVSPVMDRVLVSRGFERLSAPVLFAGHEWMGFVFLFISAQFLGDCLRMLLSLIRRVFRGLGPALDRRAAARPVAVAVSSFVIIALI